MEKKDLISVVCALSFIAGALFVITNPEITGNVIGATESNFSNAGLIGILIIVSSLGIFMLNLNHNEKT